MKLEFLERGSPDCPLIRLYEFAAKESYNLRRIALQLARGREQTVLFHEQPGVISIGSCRLTLHQGEEDCGVSEFGARNFKWVLSKVGWFQVAGLIRPFSKGATVGFQWLSERGKARILISSDGRW